MYKVLDNLAVDGLQRIEKALKIGSVSTAKSIIRDVEEFWQHTNVLNNFVRIGKSRIDGYEIQQEAIRKKKREAEAQAAMLRKQQE